jgi:hypothetical protein
MKLFYLLLLISISSCTITKRVHQPGYHVQWNKQLSKSFEKEVLQTKEHEETLTTEIIESNEENETIDLTTSDLTQKENDVDEITDVVKSEKKKAFYLNPSPSITIKKVFAEKNDQKATIHSIKKSTTSENGNTANILAIVSFVLSILTILAIVFISFIRAFIWFFIAIIRICFGNCHRNLFTSNWQNQFRYVHIKSVSNCFDLFNVCIFLNTSTIICIYSTTIWNVLIERSNSCNVHFYI